MSTDDIILIQRIADELADAGILVDFCYGRCGKGGKLWTVDVLRGYQFFDKPFSALTLLQAARIAHKECKDRGWLVNGQ